MQKDASKVPNCHLVVFFILVLFSRDELGWFVFGAPQIFAIESLGLAVIITEDQALHFPYLTASYEMLCSQISMPVSVHDQGVDCLQQLLEDHHAILLRKDLFGDVLGEVAIIRFGDQAHQFFIRDLCAYGKEVLLEYHVIQILENLGIELEALIISLLL